MLYSRTGGPKAQGIMEIMAGAVLLAFGGFTALGILVAFFSGLSAGSGLVVGVVMLLVAGAGGFVLSRGLRLNRMVNHFDGFVPDCADVLTVRFRSFPDMWEKAKKRFAGSFVT
ncbi:MAG: hypothetical protein ACLTTZ_06975 [Lachnospiraceae bacterium]